MIGHNSLVHKDLTEMNTVPLLTLGEDTRETYLKDTAQQNLSLPASDTKPSIWQCLRKLNLLVHFHMTTKLPLLKLQPSTAIRFLFLIHP